MCFLYQDSLNSDKTTKQMTCQGKKVHPNNKAIATRLKRATWAFPFPVSLLVKQRHISNQQGKLRMGNSLAYNLQRLNQDPEAKDQSVTTTDSSRSWNIYQKTSLSLSIMKNPGDVVMSQQRASLFLCVPHTEQMQCVCQNVSNLAHTPLCLTARVWVN